MLVLGCGVGMGVLVEGAAAAAGRRCRYTRLWGGMMMTWMSCYECCLWVGDGMGWDGTARSADMQLYLHIYAYYAVVFHACTYVCKPKEREPGDEVSSRDVCVVCS